MKRIPSLDGFRAISISLILICHSRYSIGFPAGLADLARHGAVGVTVFFVISGFLITTLLLIEESKHGHINVGAFYIRRAFRILPVFILYVLFIIIWRNFENIGVSRNNIIHAFTFTVNFDPHSSWFLGHMWSLSVEEQFYLICPVILVFFRKHIKSILVILILYSCIARVIDYKFPHYSTVSLSPFFMHANAILIGVFGGVLYFENPEIAKHKIFRPGWLQLLALVVAVLFIYLSGYGKLAIISLPFSNLVISLAVLFLIFSYITPSNNLMYKILNYKAFIHIGVLSYSIYIWQEFFFVGEPRFAFLRTFPSNILLIYLVSVASYYVWEQPFLKLRRYVNNVKQIG